MVWGAVIGAGVSLLGGLSSGSANKQAAKAQRVIDEANAKVQNMLGQANADAANLVRKGANQFAVAQSSLSNFIRSMGNQGKLREGGEALNALNTNLVRLQDQAVNGSLNQRITAAEQLGAVRAATAASGAGGTSAAMLNQTLQLAQSREVQASDQNMKYQTYDMLAQKAGLVSNMVLSIDGGQTFAPVDYGIDVAPLIQAPFRAENYMGKKGIMSYIDPGLAEVVSGAFGIGGGDWLMGSGGLMRGNQSQAAHFASSVVQGFRATSTNAYTPKAGTYPNHGGNWSF